MHRLRSIDIALPPPLAPEVAAERLAGLAPGTRRRRSVLVAAAVVLLVAAAVAGGFFATRGSSTPTGKITLLQLDPRSGDIVRTVRDGTLGCPCGANLFAVDGTLWERAGINGDRIVVRDMSSGRVQRVTQAPVGSIDGAVGFGSIWLLRSILVAKGGYGVPTLNGVQRLDELSGGPSSDSTQGRHHERHHRSATALSGFSSRTGRRPDRPGDERVTGSFATGRRDVDPADGATLDL
jgi:hypothetical protein